MPYESKTLGVLGKHSTNVIALSILTCFYGELEIYNVLDYKAFMCLHSTTCVASNQTFASNKTFISWMLINSDKRSAVSGSWNPGTSTLI